MLTGKRNTMAILPQKTNSICTGASNESKQRHSINNSRKRNSLQLAGRLPIPQHISLSIRASLKRLSLDRTSYSDSASQSGIISSKNNSTSKLRRLSWLRRQSKKSRKKKKPRFYLYKCNPFYLHAASYKRIFKDSAVHNLKLLKYGTLSALVLVIPCFLFHVNPYLRLKNHSFLTALFSVLGFIPVLMFFHLAMTCYDTVEVWNCKWMEFWELMRTMRECLPHAIFCTVWGGMFPFSFILFLFWSANCSVIKWTLHVFAFLVSYYCMVVAAVGIRVYVVDKLHSKLFRQHLKKWTRHPLFWTFKVAIIRTRLFLSILFGINIYISALSFGVSIASKNKQQEVEPNVIILFIFMCVVCKAIAQYRLRKVLVTKITWNMPSMQYPLFLVTAFFDTQLRMAIARFPKIGNVVLISILVMLFKVITRSVTSYHHMKKQLKRISVQLDDVPEKSLEHKSNKENNDEFRNEDYQNKNQQNCAAIKPEVAKPTNPVVVKRHKNIPIILIIALERSTDKIAGYLSIFIGFLVTLTIQSSPNFTLPMLQAAVVNMGINLVAQVGLEFIANVLTTCFELTLGVPALVIWKSASWSILLNLTSIGSCSITLLFLSLLKADD